MTQVTMNAKSPAEAAIFEMMARKDWKSMRYVAPGATATVTPKQKQSIRPENIDGSKPTAVVHNAG